MPIKTIAIVVVAVFAIIFLSYGGYVGYKHYFGEPQPPSGEETAEGKPFGTDLSTGILNGNNLTTNTNGEWYTIDMSSSLLKNSTQYALTAICPNGTEDDINSIRWLRDTDNGYLTIK